MPTNTNVHSSFRRLLRRAGVNAWVAVTLAVFLAACGTEQPELPFLDGQRIVQPLNQGWRFTLSAAETVDAVPDEKWKDVTLPHTWNAKDGQNGGDDYHRGTGIYRRQLVLDERYQGKHVYLHIDGATIATTVYVNNKLAGQHKGSYGAFRFDVSKLVKPGDNDIEVHVSNAPEDHVAPLSADFTFFGGLYRQMRLIATNPVHLDTTNYASNGVFWSQRKVDKDLAELELRTRLFNEAGNTEALSVQAEMRDDKGMVVARSTQELTLEAGQAVDLEMKLTVDNPHLWHGRKDPYLYRATVSVLRGDEELDTVAENIGLRFFHVDRNKGFFLNGESYPLRGINRMPDFLNKGAAVNREDHERDLQLMLDLGATSLRLGHQQRDPYVYRRADETGLVVWAEVPLINRIQDSPEFTANIKQQTLELVRQNYNHASIVIWGLYNEITLKPGPNPIPLVEQLNALVKTEDPGRLTTAAVAAEGGLDDSLVTTPDLISFNRYDGWYYGNFGHFTEFLDTLHEEGPDLRVGISEYGAGASIEAAFQTDTPVMQDHSEQYQALYHEAYWESLSQRPWVWGQYIWVLADFAVDNRNEGDTPGRNDKGLVTFDRKIKKDAYYWYQANWSQQPMLHITSRRHTQRNRGKVEIKVYSNQAEVELKVNGKSLGVKQHDGLSRFIWSDVPLAMGENKIEVLADTGQTVLTDQMLLTRVNSDDTSISSALLGVDVAAGKIYNPPFGASLEALSALLILPDESQITPVEANESPVLQAGMKVRVTAQDGTSHRDYLLEQAPLSVGKPVWASSEIAADISIGPIDIPVMSAAKANDGIVKVTSEGLTDVNLWNTMGGSSHWWKVDLGADYYLERIEIVWPQHSSLIEAGSMEYSVETAQHFEQTFNVFSETYTERVDGRDNKRSGTTRDTIGAVGRFVQVRLHKSGIFSDTPLVGKYPIYGAEEITVLGGLLYSDKLDIDYQQHTVRIATSLLVGEVRSQLQSVGNRDLQLRDDSGNILQGQARIDAGAQIIVQDVSGRLVEKYTVTK